MHFGFAALFFGAIAYLLFRHFPLELSETQAAVKDRAGKSKRGLTEEEKKLIAIKQTRKTAYIRCGRIIIAMIVLIGLDFAWGNSTLATLTSLSASFSFFGASLTAFLLA